MNHFDTYINHDQYGLYCKQCNLEYDSKSCRLVDIVETISGRSYVYVCPFCGTQQSGDIIEMEIDYGRKDSSRRKRVHK